MPVLHIGVVDLPYADKSGVTTGDVAEWLEEKYGVMAAFVQRHGEDIGDALANSVAGALESIAMGAPASIDAFGFATSDIDKTFRKFLSDSEIEQMGVQGVPTQAALDGVSHRFKNKKNKGNKKKRKGKRRPSFIDTGLYQSSEKSWVE